MGRMTDTELKALIHTHISNAAIYHSEIANRREEALDRYRGEPYGTEQDGRSQVVSKDLMDTVEWIMPSLLKVFHSGKKIAEFDPTGPEDEESAEQATDYVNYVHLKDNDGFEIDYTWFKDALIQANGYVKTWWESKEETSEEEFAEQTELELAKMFQDAEKAREKLEVIEQEEILVEEPVFDEVGNLVQPAIVTFNVKLRRTKTIEGVREENVPPEEILVSPYTKNLTKPDFLAHWRTRTRTDLINAGYRKGLVNGLPKTDNTLELSSEKNNRYGLEEGFVSDIGKDKSMDEINTYECYMWVDYDGDGIAEYRMITVAGNPVDEILDNEVVDDHPIDDLCPILMPHTHHGMGMNDLVSDLQKIKTAIWRQSLDILYQANQPKWKVLVDSQNIPQANMGDLLNSKLNQPVRVRSMDAIDRLIDPVDPSQSFPMMEYIDRELKDRTGVSESAGLDADALNNNAGAFANAALITGAKQRIELIALLFAKTGFGAGRSGS